MKDIKDFIISNLEFHKKDIAKFTARQFGITVQAVNKHIKKLIAEGVIGFSGNTSARNYFLVKKTYSFIYKICDNLSESTVWASDIEKHVPQKSNVQNIWSYGFMEMFNNAIEHSGGTEIKVFILKDAVKTTIAIIDNGIGIFKNIQQKFNLFNEHEAILELSKGKLTTAKSKHSGEGVFFTSRAFDHFLIESHGIMFAHNSGDIDILFECIDNEPTDGTTVIMEMNNDSERVLRDIFDAFSGEDYGFDKTIIPIKLARYTDIDLISRSQARRVLSRVQLFKNVVFDFENVPQIGQAFADEIFRVFANAHPNIKLEYINANKLVENMILRAKTSNIGEI